MEGIISGSGSSPKPKGKGKKKTSPEIPLLKESQIQMQCVDWFSHQYRSLFEAGKLVHIANERKCSSRAGRELNKMGVRKGIPDLSLFIAKKGYHGLFIEMKRPREYPRPEQRAMMASLEEEGYKCVVCRSLEEFRKIINEYLI